MSELKQSTKHFRQNPKPTPFTTLNPDGGLEYPEKSQLMNMKMDKWRARGLEGADGKPFELSPEIVSYGSTSKKDWGGYYDTRKKHVEEARKKSPHYTQGRPYNPNWLGGSRIFGYPAHETKEKKLKPTPLPFEDVLNAPIAQYSTDAKPAFGGSGFLSGETYPTDARLGGARKTLGSGKMALKHPELAGRNVMKTGEGRFAPLDSATPFHPPLGNSIASAIFLRAPKLDAEGRWNIPGHPSQEEFDQTQSEEVAHALQGLWKDDKGNYISKEATKQENYPGAVPHERWAKLLKAFKHRVRQQYNTAPAFERAKKDHAYWTKRHKDARKTQDRFHPNLTKERGNALYWSMWKKFMIAEKIADAEGNILPPPAAKDYPPRTTPWTKKDSERLFQDIYDKGTGIDRMFDTWLKTPEGKKWLMDRKSSIIDDGGFFDTHVQADPKRKAPAGFPYAPTRMHA